MRLTLSCQHNDSVLSVDISPDMTLGDFRAYVEAETGIGPLQQVLMHNAQPMTGDSRELNSWGLIEGDMVLLMTRDSVGSQQSAPSAGLPNEALQQIEQMRQRVLNDPVMREGVRRQYPELESVVDDPTQFSQKMIELEQKKQDSERERQEELRRLQNDPDNPENQAKIMELIQQEAISENMNLALEHNPEVFGTVNMLFVNVEVNGQKVKAFVDSGAQTTIMSPECVEHCNLTHLIDKRFSGIARGVGEAKIIGKVHSAPIKIGDGFFPCSFTVMEGKGVDLLLGLDMLKRYQGLIDLKNNKLVLGDCEVPFLPDSEIPAQFQMEEPSASNTNTAAKPNTETSVPSESRGGRTPHADEVVSNLMNLGFSRDESIKALDMANGNAEVAAALLFQGI
ncbi:hypothetical protein TRICI_001472 [Trichomonascus ciferrii]|uniref:DNA damage-inducible protein 1 n=1 Tax=Trichomonascus ciferrii TaxID=44093 RepID=A0A642V9B3_9ASCO|nr:hypothetical protein TRICI_001472 [Trichomonascus ciferrii]